MERIKLRKLREEKGFTQRAVADLILKDPSVYSRIEAGTARLTDDIMVRLCKILECRLEDLIDEKIYYFASQEETNTPSQLPDFCKKEEIRELALQIQVLQERSVERLTTLFIQAVERIAANKKGR